MEEKCNMNPTITVITVCWNAENEIKETVKSVFQQTFDNYEYLIVDGLSTDHTILFLKEEAKKANKEQKVRIISEEDHGIYDAMNKGIRYAKGDWLLFLNAGDRLDTNNILDEVIPFLDEDYDFIYGNAKYLSKEGEYIVESKPIESISIGMPFCHQCVFSKRSIMLDTEFDTQYKICADYDMFSRAYTMGSKFYRFDSVIADYRVGGFSEKHQDLMCKEIVRIKKKNGFIKHEGYSLLMLRTRIVIGRAAKRVLPVFLRKMIRRAK